MRCYHLTRYHLLSCIISCWETPNQSPLPEAISNPGGSRAEKGSGGDLVTPGEAFSGQSFSLPSVPLALRIPAAVWPGLDFFPIPAPTDSDQRGSFEKSRAAPGSLLGPLQLCGGKEPRTSLEVSLEPIRPFGRERRLRSRLSIKPSAD